MGSRSSKMATMLDEGSAHFSSLEEDITCSICLQELSDSVSITCGHTFCRPCISAYWATSQSLGHHCPECRKVCPRDQLIPAYRLQHLVSRVQQNRTRKTRAGAVQMVYTGPQSKMWLDESIVEQCFLDSRVSDAPLCLICVIGEKRRGKSSLLNYIVRALRCLEKGQPVSLGGEDEPLEGFEWQSGTARITKGIWIWNRPFMLKRNEEKLAVYVLDTEGSLDIEGDLETCIKLSALSMLLSSYLIFNVNTSLKTTELDYLEMYLHVSELAAESFALQSLQHLNILLRDWQDPDNCGREAAMSYVKDETESLRRSEKNPRVLETLSCPSVSSFLLPHPGKNFLRSGHGRLSDMDEDFRGHLTHYISDLVRGVWSHCKTGIRGERITCGQLGQLLKEFVHTLQKEHLTFASPMEMFHFIENQENMRKTLKEFQEFVGAEAPLTSSPFKILGVTTSKMRLRVSEEATSLQREYERSLRGSNQEQRRKLLEEMKNLLDEEVEKFCTEYSKRFTKCAVGVGCAVGGGVLSLAGGVAGATVAGTVLAAEAAAILGSTTAAMVTGAVGGSVTLGAIGTGVGAGVGGVIGHRGMRQEERTDNGSDDNESEDTQELLLNEQ